MSRIRSHLTYSNVMVTILAFIVLGGGAYAAFHLPRNSVRSRNIVNGQVKARDLVKPQPLKSAGLAASNGSCASTPNQWTSYQLAPQAPEGPVGYYRDADAQVHLNGTALRCGNPPSGITVFTLPQGYRPTVDQNQATVQSGATAGVVVFPSGEVHAISSADGDLVSLDGIIFRCAPSGKNGCPLGP